MKVPSFAESIPQDIFCGQMRRKVLKEEFLRGVEWRREGGGDQETATKTSAVISGTVDVREAMLVVAHKE